MADQPTPRRDRERNAALVDYLARERYGWLHAQAKRRGVPPDSVEDVVQSALLDVLRSFPGPDEHSYVVAYAARCVQNQAYKLHRRHTRKERHNVPMPERESSDRLGSGKEVGLADASEPGPLERAISLESTGEPRELLSELTDDQLTVVVLIAAGFSHQEIAERTGISVRAIRKRVERANRRLRGRE